MPSDGRHAVRLPRTQPAFIASYKEPWTASAFEHFYRFSLDLASTGASAAIAKTAIAPLERAKASPRISPHCEGCLSLWLASCRNFATLMAKESTGYVVQILMQVSPMNSQPNAGKYSSAWDALKRIPQREGWMVSIPAV